MALKTDCSPAQFSLNPGFSYSPTPTHKGVAVIASVIFHGLLLALYLGNKSTPLKLDEQAGNAGMAMSWVAVAPLNIQPSPPSPAVAESAIPVILEPIIKDAAIVIERKEKPVAPKPVKKAVPVVKEPKRALAEKSIERPVSETDAMPGQGSETHSNNQQAAPTSIGSGGAATHAGESTAGSAPRGAGTSTSSHMRVLNRRVNYPSRARSMGVEGKVKAQFDITASGTIKNIRILAEDPPGMFAADLERDISRWRYDTTGEFKNQIVTVVFKIDGRIQVIN